LARVIKGLDFTYPFHVHDMGPSFWNRISETFQLDARIVVSRPSPVETSIKQASARTVAAHLLKVPGYLESLLSPAGRKDRWWTLVGGWELLLQTASRP